MKVLFAVKIGDPDYMEQLITEQENKIPEALKWAIENGFDRLRIANIDDNPPNFTKVLSL